VRSSSRERHYPSAAVTVWAEDAKGFDLDQDSLDALASADAACERGEGQTLEQLIDLLVRSRAA
jgi:hypothetical protein